MGRRDGGRRRFDLSAYAGKSVGLRVRYTTDGAARGNTGDTSPSGIFVDAISITNNRATVFTDGAENGANGWTLNGFTAVGTTTTTPYDNYYISGHRSYVSYDKYLKTGPYNFGFGPAKPDLVEHFPYQQGLLISYWDTSQSDRVQIYDAPFSLTTADSFTLHVNGQPSYIRGEAGQPLFDDTKQYFDPELPDHGVKLRAVGVKIRVLSEDGTSMRIRVF